MDAEVDTSEKSDTQKIADILQEEGYRAKILDDGKSILSAASGSNFYMYVRDANIQMRAIFENQDGKFGPLQANTFNKKYRFVKIYADDDNDILLEFDGVFCENATELKGQIIFSVNMLEAGITALKDLMRSMMSGDEQ